MLGGLLNVCLHYFYVHSYTIFLYFVHIYTALPFALFPPTWLIFTSLHIPSPSPFCVPSPHCPLPFFLDFGYDIAPLFSLDIVNRSALRKRAWAFSKCCSDLGCDLFNKYTSSNVTYPDVLMTYFYIIIQSVKKQV